MYTLLVLVVMSFLQWSPVVEASSSVFLYSGPVCADPSTREVYMQPDDGCTKIDGAFASFQTADLGPGCIVTAYGHDDLYCGTAQSFALVPGKCYSNNTQINQFTVTCVPNYTNTTVTISSLSGTMTTSMFIVAIVVPVAAFGLVFIAVFVWRWWRHPRRFCPDLPSSSSSSSGWKVWWVSRNNKETGLLVPDLPELHDTDEKYAELEDRNSSCHALSSRNSSESMRDDRMSPVELDSTVVPLRELEAQTQRNRLQRSWIDPKRWSWARSVSDTVSKRTSWI